MALTLFHHLPFSSPTSFPKLPNLRFASTSVPYSRASALASQMDLQGDQPPRFKDFPYVSAPVRDLMVDLVSTVESRLESQLLPCTLPLDVQYYQNESGTAHGSIFVRKGASDCPIDFVFGSWVHCELPTGAALNITSLLAYMNDSTDAPQLLIEIIQSNPTSLVMLLDLPPRRDLVLHPDYLKTFYEDSGLENQRQRLYEIPEVQQYISSSLYIRCLFSPTAVVIRVDTSKMGKNSLEEILKDNVSDVAKKVLGIWFDLCVFRERQQIEDIDRVYLKKRDSMFKEKSIEIDLGSSLPKMFGQETAERILGALRGI